MVVYFVHSRVLSCTRLFFFFFNDTATTEIYTLSLHDALPICLSLVGAFFETADDALRGFLPPKLRDFQSHRTRSEEHTSELQSHLNLVCRLLLEKKKNKKETSTSTSRHHLVPTPRTDTRPPIH